MSEKGKLVIPSYDLEFIHRKIVKRLLHDKRKLVIG